MIPQGAGTYIQRRSGTRPWTKRQGDPLDDVARSHSKSQPEPCKTVKLPKRTQDHHRKIGAQLDRANSRLNVGKRFIDDQPTTAPLQQLGCM